MKYKNKKITYDGHKFDSLKECQRYKDLRLLERAGKISDLRLQVPFELVKGVKYTGAAKATPALRYYADFVYIDSSGEQIVEDVKGYKTQVYKNKRHMMLGLLGIEVMEV